MDVFSNPFVIVYLLLGFISLMASIINDGEPIPEQAQYYNSTRTLLSFSLSMVLLVAALWWQAAH